VITNHFYFSHRSADRRAVLKSGAGSLAALLLGAGASASAMTSDKVMLAKPWTPTLNPAHYLVSEKLDGVRALWDGQQLLFRSGRPIAAPSWFVAGLPAVALDGELWMGRHTFDALSGAVRKEVPLDAQWRALRYMVFDVPSLRRPFEERAAQIKEVVAAARQPWLEAVEQNRVFDAVALQARLNRVVAEGGEGLVLHRADALWEAGRSDALRKLKAEPDEEGLVVSHVAGGGKYAGRMGALVVETPEGRRFLLGTGFTDAQRTNPPALGSVVTYRYRDRTVSGLPKFASFLRIRDAD